MSLMYLPGFGIPATELPGSQACYRLFGPADTFALAEASTDLLSLVPVAVGEFADVLQADSTVKYYGMEAVSNSGVASERTVVRVDIDGTGEVITARPNAISQATAHPAAGGTLRVDIAYQANNQEAVAVEVDVAEVVAGIPQWETPVLTVAVSAAGLTTRSGTTTDFWNDEEVVSLVARAVAADGVVGPVYTLDDVTADDNPPNPVSVVTAEVNNG